MADGEKRIKELEEITALTSNDYFVVDSSASGGKTKKYKSTYITDIINNIPELVAEFEPNHYYDRDVLVAHEGKVYYHNAPGASYEEFPTGYQFIQIDLTGLLSRLGFGISIQHNSSFTYNKGDYCMEDYILYRCLNDNVTGAWSSSDWERASLGYDLSSIYKPRLDEHDEQIEEALALGTASGSIASFTDGSTLPMRKLEVAIEPQQDLHGYDNPWVGGAGKNKEKPYSYTVTAPNGVTFTYNGDGSVTLNGTATASQAVPSVAIAVQNNLTFTLGSGTWIPSVSANNVTYEVYDTATSTLLSNGASFTLTEAKTVLFRVGAVNGQTYNNLKVYMQIESGTTATSFAPYSNICPISGWDECNVTRCGKNLFDSELSQGGIYPDSGNNYSSNIYVRTDFIPLKKGTYTISQNIQNAIRFYDKNKIYNRSKGIETFRTANTITLEDDSYIKIVFRASDSSNITPSSVSNIQLEVGDTATTYEPYNGQTYTIDLDGTRYGGTLDVVSGILTIDRGYVTYDGSETWQTTSGTGYYQFNKNQNDALNSVNAICDKFEKIATSERSQKSGLVSYASDKLMRFSVTTDFGISTVEEWKTWLASNNVQVCYELATPQTIQLTPTEVKSLLATNNVFADTGDILDATYVRNANITINDLIRRIENLEG